jgi:SAM-dependent methyltransferase
LRRAERQHPDSPMIKALRLDELRLSGQRRKPLKGLSILHLHCGEGSVCQEALKQGARQVVGFDGDPRLIEAAGKQCPGGRFRCASWRDMPDEEFDVIFLLSGLEEESEPRVLLEKIRERLAPRGKLVLECDHAGDDLARRLRTLRVDGKLRSYPTLGYLVDVLLQGYAVRRFGSTVRRPVGPVRRSLFHCTPFASTALLVSARGGSGKTTLSREFLEAGWPDVSTDRLFHRLLREDDFKSLPLAKRVREVVGCASTPNWSDVATDIVKDRSLVEEFCELLGMELPVESPYFFIEGDALRHRRIMEELVKRLKKRGVRPWIVTPG